VFIGMAHEGSLQLTVEPLDPAIGGEISRSSPG